MAITQRTAEEAKAFIAESLKHWEDNGESKKIISLAAFAEKWRSGLGSPVAKMKSLQKSIKALQLILKRNKKIDIPSGILEDQVEYLQGEYKELVDKYGEPKVKKAKIIEKPV